MDTAMFVHKSVLLQASVDALQVKPDGVYIDATAGGGGHSARIAEQLTVGHLYCIDRDPDAIAALREKFGKNQNVTMIQDNFFHIKAIARQYEIPPADGILADLGVSSYQLDTPERGFSYHHDAPLDMRMEKDGPSAADLVNTLDEQELARIFFRFGEEKYARSIARSIVKKREREPIVTTAQLAELVKVSVPQAVRRASHPARQTFQALRIAVNGELEALTDAINDLFGQLLPGTGRLAVISFHSLEDRIVKQSFAALCKGCICPPHYPVCVCGQTPKGTLPMKWQSPSEAELAENPRSRSAKLRVIQRN